MPILEIYLPLPQPCRTHCTHLYLCRSITTKHLSLTVTVTVTLSLTPTLTLTLNLLLPLTVTLTLGWGREWRTEWGQGHGYGFQGGPFLLFLIVVVAQKTPLAMLVTLQL